MALGVCWWVAHLCRWWHPPAAPWLWVLQPGFAGDIVGTMLWGEVLTGSWAGPQGLGVPVPSLAMPPSPLAPGSPALDMVTSPCALLLGDTQDVTPLSPGRDMGQSLEGWGGTCRIRAGSCFIPAWEFASHL